MNDARSASRSSLDKSWRVPVQAGTRQITLQRVNDAWYVHINGRTYYALYDNGKLERWYFPPQEGPRVTEITDVDGRTEAES